MAARVNIVVALAANGVIGRDGGLPWHLPGDLKRFREITWGHPIVMGRRTHASIGRVLPGRLNIVISRDPGAGAAGAVVVRDLDAALAAAGEVPEVMIVGGAAVYAAALPRAARLFLTEVHAAVDGDVRFPDFDRSAWRETAREPHRGEGEFDYSFVTLERIVRE
ncbi:MAG TPA: dihydrofolate reductase [Gammaproteobacteria bacterium]|nr:dihydrofolate reductase [Gammaproteobacteria bacterium]